MLKIELKDLNGVSINIFLHLRWSSESQWSWNEANR